MTTVAGLKEAVPTIKDARDPGPWFSFLDADDFGTQYTNWRDSARSPAVLPSGSLTSATAPWGGTGYEIDGSPYAQITGENIPEGELTLEFTFGLGPILFPFGHIPIIAVSDGTTNEYFDVGFSASSGYAEMKYYSQAGGALSVTLTGNAAMNDSTWHTASVALREGSISFKLDGQRIGTANAFTLWYPDRLNVGVGGNQAGGTTDLWFRAGPGHGVKLFNSFRH